jgi:hypothetical protein
MSHWDRKERSRKKKLRIAAAGGGHVMAKPEAAVMRRIRSETGMTEAQVREIKKYRKMLSDAQLSDTEREKLALRRQFHADHQSKWSWGSEKAMFKQKTMQILLDKEATARLYKRYAGGLVDNKRPTNFHYRKFDKTQPETQIMLAIDKTDGQFVYSPDRNEVGFRYADSLTIFSLVYQVQ